MSDGQPRAKVYVAVDKPSATLDILVKELVTAVKLSTGTSWKSSRRNYRGQCAGNRDRRLHASRAAGIEAAAIPVEGFVIKTAPNRVFLVGSTTRLPEVVDFNGLYGNEGTAWALADFLERFLAVAVLVLAGERPAAAASCRQGGWRSDRRAPATSRCCRNANA